MRIGVIGSGNMGSTLGTLWAKAGHDILFSSRHPEELSDLVAKVPRSKVGTAEEAAKFGDAIFIGVPYVAMPELTKTLAPLLAG
jgi:8-hydroxy-5-deazaflavin:NADPH oxidoreductase